MPIIAEIVGALVLIGLFAYGVQKFYERFNNGKEKEIGDDKRNANAKRK